MSVQRKGIHWIYRIGQKYEPSPFVKRQKAQSQSFLLISLKAIVLIEYRLWLIAHLKVFSLLSHYVIHLCIYIILIYLFCIYILTSFSSLPLSRASRTHLSKNDRPLQHPQSAGASSIKVYRHRTRRHQQVGMAGQSASWFLLFLHGTFWPAELLCCGWERE